MILVLIGFSCSKYDQSEPKTALFISATLIDDSDIEVQMLIYLGDSTDTLKMQKSNSDTSFYLPTRNVVRVLRVKTDSLGIAFRIVKSLCESFVDTVRKIPVRHFVELKPTFYFNKPYLPNKKRMLSLAVNMSNQEVLGFFDPSKGDKVNALGNYYNWSAEGVSLHADTSGIYRLETEVAYFDGNHLNYSYRIISNRNNFLPNNGFETTTRLPNDDKNQVDWYNHQKRIARFMISGQKINISEHKYIGIWLNERLVQSDALIQVKNNLWETAFSVPEDFNEINWAVIDAQQVPITEIQKLVISDNGVLISR